MLKPVFPLSFTGILLTLDSARPGRISRQMPPPEAPTSCLVPGFVRFGFCLVIVLRCLGICLVLLRGFI